MPTKIMLGKNVLEAAMERIAWTFDNFPRVYCSFSAGKDSTVMLHLVAEQARKLGRKFGLLLVDLEAQYKHTIDHAENMFDMYSDVAEPYWISLPINLRNAVSQYEPFWTCWQPDRQSDWIRQPPDIAITDLDYFSFYRYRRSGRQMEFEEFVPLFGDWYSQGKPCACFVGIRTDESLNRWRTISGHGTKLDGRNYTNHVMKTTWNVYPIYDWKTADIWRYHARTKKAYNKLYDIMHQAGLSIHEQRICQPYGDDQRKGLYLFKMIEPETWSRIVARVNGANQGALYAKESGNILGRIKIDKPEGHTWESFANMLMDSMPPPLSNHYKNKIAVFIKWWMDKEPSLYSDGIPDEMPSDLEASKVAPSWRRICKTLLRNDYWCKGLGFSQQTGTAHQQYLKLMKKRRQQWNIYND